MARATSPDIPVYFAPEAFNTIAPVAAGIGHDPEQLDEIANFVRGELGARYGLPCSVAEATLVYRYVASRGSGIPQRLTDPSITGSKFSDHYYPADQLAAGQGETIRTVSRDAVLGLGRYVHQIDLKDSDSTPLRPTVRHYINSLLYPPAEDLRIAAGPGAWWRQVTDVSEGRKRRAREAFILKYTQAVWLEPRE